MGLSQEVGSIQNFLRKPITTWDFPGGGVWILCLPSGSALVFISAHWTWGSNIHKGADYKNIISLSMYREKFYDLTRHNDNWGNHYIFWKL